MSKCLFVHDLFFHQMPGPGREPRVNDQEILEVFRASSDPFLTTKEISEQLDLGRRGTFDRLVRLSEEDQLKSKKVGESATIWWLPSDD